MPSLFPSLLFLVVLLIPLTAAAPAPARTVVVHAIDDGRTFYFRIDGLSGKNPDLLVAPGELVRIHFYNEGTVPHDFNVSAAAGGGILCCVQPGHEVEGTFQAPMENTELVYLCTLHKDLQMRGRILVGEGASTQAPRVAPALAATAAILLLGIVLVAMRKRLGT